MYLRMFDVNMFVFNIILTVTIVVITHNVYRTLTCIKLLKKLNPAGSLLSVSVFKC